MAQSLNLAQQTVIFLLQKEIALLEFSLIFHKPPEVQNPALPGNDEKAQRNQKNAKPGNHPASGRLCWSHCYDKCYIAYFLFGCFHLEDLEANRED